MAVTECPVFPFGDQKQPGRDLPRAAVPNPTRFGRANLYCAASIADKGLAAFDADFDRRTSALT